MLLEVLATAQRAGFLGPGPVQHHVDLAEAFVAAVPPPVRFLDLGSGGGVPGLVLAVRWPAAVGLLLDAQARRVAALQAAIAALGIADRVVARHGRAEEVAREPAHRAGYPVVTARSFGPPGQTAECGAGFLAPGGVLLVAEPPDGGGDRWPRAGLAQLGLVDAGVASGGGGTVRRLRLRGAVPEHVPRRAAAIARSPRF